MAHLTTVGALALCASDFRTGARRRIDGAIAVPAIFAFGNGFLFFAGQATLLVALQASKLLLESVRPVSFT